MNTQATQQAKKLLIEAKELIRFKKSKDAIEVLENLFQIENKYADFDSICAEAKNIYKKQQELRNLRRYRIFLIIVFFATSISLVILNWMRVGDTSVEIKFTVSKFSLKLAQDWNLPPFYTNLISLSNVQPLSFSLDNLEVAVEFDEKTDVPTKWKDIRPSNNMLEIKQLIDNWNKVIKVNYNSLSTTTIIPYFPWGGLGLF